MGATGRDPSSRGAEHAPAAPGRDRENQWRLVAGSPRRQGRRSWRPGRPRREGSRRVRGVLSGSDSTPCGAASFPGRGPFKGGQTGRPGARNSGK
jgi:hypothetical protein